MPLSAMPLLLFGVSVASICIWLSKYRWYDNDLKGNYVDAKQFVAVATSECTVYIRDSSWDVFNKG